MGWNIDLGFFSIGSEGVEVKPQFKFGIDSENFSVGAGIGALLLDWPNLYRSTFFSSVVVCALSVQSADKEGCILVFLRECKCAVNLDI
mmetsp:Transcript_37913/g.97892  ORF Transcript_37913/g.97892 Transcript_37913/m.97892 type:complete len:89 (+) Transcript_37913:239-505(+)